MATERWSEGLRRRLDGAPIDLIPAVKPRWSGGYRSARQLLADRPTAPQGGSRTGSERGHSSPVNPSTGRGIRRIVSHASAPRQGLWQRPVLAPSVHGRARAKGTSTGRRSSPSVRLGPVEDHDPYEVADYGASPSRAECISILQSSAPRVRSCRSAIRHPSGRRTIESW
jgi:hypothetical protein